MTEDSGSALPSPSDHAPSFPPAAQADLVRAAQKDKLCMGVLESSLFEVVHNIFGPNTLMKHRDALRTTACVLYYSLCTGVGQQTLGEEYCDILQTTRDGLEPSAAQRVSQVLMYSLTPLLQAKVTSASLMHASPDASQVRDAQPGPIQPGVSADTLGVLGGTRHPGAQSLQHTEASGSAEQRGGTLHPGAQSLQQTEASGSAEQRGGTRHPGAQSLQHTEASGSAEQRGGDTAGVLHALQSLRGRYGEMSRACAARWGQARWAQWWGKAAVALAALLPLLSQAHLAVFYLRGVFFEVPKRLAGVRMTYMGVNAQRQYYGVMGALLFVQLAARVFQKLRPNDKASASPVEDLLVSGGLAHESALPQLPCPADDAKHASSQWKVQGSHRPSDSDTRCPLCLSRRVVPTAMPCGHVLCWNCVVSWCQRKEECPVCRRPAKLQELVPLAHTPY